MWPSSKTQSTTAGESLHQNPNLNSQKPTLQLTPIPNLTDHNPTLSKNARPKHNQSSPAPKPFAQFSPSPSHNPPQSTQRLDLTTLTAISNITQPKHNSIPLLQP
ncbi:hypothetical protein KC19_6G048100 [Ceratodon purpureus]|uniref:Uncharacterized protein n=1 Tax=Ceratodon purpureus TaxID=3225 RepID=A0A8T0HAN6_CERPU|nr:hypothetical protein KC19_6G048100 [Ceratodon purpureus]